MKMTRTKTTKANAVMLTAQLGAVEYELMRIASKVDCLTIEGAGELVQMHRTLRRLRYQIAVECRIEVNQARAGPS